MPGRVVVLNGPSSAGKTTLAHGVRARLGPMAVVVSLDLFFGCLHDEGAVDWRTYSAMTKAMFAAAAAFANDGFDVIVDTVFERRDCADDAACILAGLTYDLVAVVCSVETLDRREAQRGNRRRGQARDQHARVLHDLAYALRLDTDELDIDGCVDRVLALGGWRA